jgi:hypothetical protein
LLCRSSLAHLRESVKDVYFAVIVLAGGADHGAMSLDLGSMYGTTTYPVTYQMLELVRDVRAVPAGRHHLLRRRAGMARARGAHGADARRAAGAELAAAAGQADRAVGLQALLLAWRCCAGC